MVCGVGVFNAVKNTDMRLAEGDRGLLVGRLQRLLRLHRFDDVIMDEVFGGTTRQAVTQFQQRYELEPTGTVDSETWGALKETLVYSATEEMELRKGTRNPLAVMQLQWLLQRHRYLDVEVDGQFGPITHQAVLHFQSKYNLSADGIVNSLTWAALRSNLQKTS